MGAASQELTVLGIETSCDETAAAVVRGAPPGPGTILSNVVHGQIADHAAYGGIVPEIAARAHVEILDHIVAEALQKAGLDLDAMDGVAATAGPGLIGGVMVGLLSGKGFALAAGVPLIAVNHLEAHALTARLVGGTPFPFLMLLISGGHCQLMAAEGVGTYRIYGATIDDAVGEAFDKVAKLIGLAYPGGPKIEALAARGDASRFSLPRPMAGRDGADFSFSGLKTAVRHAVYGGGEKQDSLSGTGQADIAASFQAAVVEVIRDRVRNAMKIYRKDFAKPEMGLKFVAAGGVAANGAIRAALQSLCLEEGFSISLPPPQLCTDNAAMIAWTGVERLATGLTDPLDAPPRARWPLELLKKTAQADRFPAGLPPPA